MKILNIHKVKNAGLSSGELDEADICLLYIHKGGTGLE